MLQANYYLDYAMVRDWVANVVVESSFLENCDVGRGEAYVFTTLKNSILQEYLIFIAFWQPSFA